MCTLWQRFGRVARGENQTGTAILLVEKKDTIEDREEKEAKKVEREKNAEARQNSPSAGNLKRKAADIPFQQSKRQALADRTRVISHEANRENHKTAHEGTSTAMRTEFNDTNKSESEPRGGDEVDKTFIEERRAHYKKRKSESVSTKQPRAKKREVEIGSAMDDYINAHHSFNCRRVVLTVYFENDKARK